MATPQYEKSPIFDYSIVQCMAWIAKEFSKFSGVNLTAKMVTGPNALRQLSGMLNAPDQEPKQTELSYPYMLYTIGDISLDSTKGGFSKPKFRDILMSKDLNAGSARMADLRPVKIGIGLSFITDDFSQIKDLAHTFLVNAPAVSLIMEAADSDFRVGTTLTLSDSFSTPPVNFETPGDAYQFESIITIDTYMGTVRDARLIRNIAFSVVHSDDTAEVFAANVNNPEVLVKNVIKFTDFFNEATTPYGDGNVNN